MNDEIPPISPPIFEPTPVNCKSTGILPCTETWRVVKHVNNCINYYPVAFWCLMLDEDTGEHRMLPMCFVEGRIEEQSFDGWDWLLVPPGMQLVSWDPPAWAPDGTAIQSRW